MNRAMQNHENEKQHSGTLAAPIGELKKESITLNVQQQTATAPFVIRILWVNLTDHLWDFCWLLIRL